MKPGVFPFYRALHPMHDSYAYSQAVSERTSTINHWLAMHQSSMHQCTTGLHATSRLPHQTTAGKHVFRTCLCNMLRNTLRTQTYSLPVLVCSTAPLPRPSPLQMTPNPRVIQIARQRFVCSRPCEHRLVTLQLRIPQNHISPCSWSRKINRLSCRSHR